MTYVTFDVRVFLKHLRAFIIVDVKIKIYFSRRAMMDTPKKVVKKGRKPKSNETPNDFCRFCVCSFKVQFGNLDKVSYISTENIF